MHQIERDAFCTCQMHEATKFRRAHLKMLLLITLSQKEFLKIEKYMTEIKRELVWVIGQSSVWSRLLIVWLQSYVTDLHM